MTLSDTKFSPWWAWNLNILLLIMEKNRVGGSEGRISVFREENEAPKELGGPEVI